MTQAATDRNTRTKAGGAARTGRRPVAASAVIYKGVLIGKNAAGHVVEATDATTVSIIGISEEFVDNTGGAAAAKEISYITGLEVEMDNAGGAIVLANLGRGCYVADDSSVTTAAVSAAKVFVGTVQEFTTTKVWVYVDEAINGVLGELANAAPNVANSAVGPAVMTPGVEQTFAIDIPDAATATYSYLVPQKLEIVDVFNIKDGAGAANTIQLTNGADVAITNAMAAAVDVTRTAAGTIAKATRTLAAGATLKVVATRAAGSMAAQLFIRAIPRA
jgi:hypothetical protein